ncbi:6-phosphogluconolactonase (cycloisomerase 2 family) [Silvibacterium bohemicum]|uniref:6-phosphogluconolactonase (Cycloisomerase 2 family) n=1 Tax=Silvibacterium bohemicum TaxID=1577686 RepID=A0A841JNC4_9BACT|nr:beta-propeller fold lactonase family protein [Silvibacterium bohemicum]MBB6142753.1 6-phosphogluconolactonase (cycloisomerase 2 family) [Silvibacterium bohemicum]
MKFKKFGQIVLALVVSLGLCLSVTSCTVDFTVAYLYVTGAQFNQIGAFKVSNNTGNLSNIPGSPFGSGGTDPLRSIVSSTGRYLYVLNAGALQTDGTYSGGNIAVFSVGGDGVLAPQQTYTSQGNGSIRFGFNSTGSFLYVLDQYAPVDANNPAQTTSTTQSAEFPCPDPTTAGVWHPVGDITAFSVNTNTGRLSLITNNQQQTGNGTQLGYFPIGCNPIDLNVASAFVFAADAGPEPATTGFASDNRQTIFEYALNSSSGQLTLTQNAELVTNAAKISNMGSSASGAYIFVLDTGNNQVYSYTVGTNGILQSVTDSPFPNSQSTSGNPIALTTDSKSQFLYLANAGPSSSVGNANSQISGYTIASNGVLAQISGAPFPTGSSPQCILEDPSHQYIYTADFISSTVTGHVLDPNSGVLTDLRNKTSYATVGNPTWCVASGHTD